MRPDEELLKVSCALLEIRRNTGEEETEEVLRLLKPYTREEVERINELAEEYPNIAEAEAIERYRRHHGGKVEGGPSDE
jgi:hypothetical protein